MEELRRIFGQEELHVPTEALEVGEPVEIVGGAFHGLEAVVTQVLPARKRVMVLLEFLGRQTAVELPLDQVLREGEVRSQLAQLRGRSSERGA